MNRTFLAVGAGLAVLVAAAAMLSKPPSLAAQPPSPASAVAQATTIAAKPLTLRGVLETLDQSGSARLLFSAGSTVLADVAVKDGQWSATLPASISNPDLGTLENVKLVYGYGRLKIAAGSSVQGANVKVQTYSDENKNAKFDAGETASELSLFPAGKETGMRGFFKYQLVLLSGNAALKEQQDAPSGAKNYYRYNLELGAGYNLLEGELASNGYEIRQLATKASNNFDAFVVQRGGGEGPPMLKP
jgi:hypothetical protein